MDKTVKYDLCPRPEYKADSYSNRLTISTNKDKVKIIHLLLSFAMKTNRTNNSLGIFKGLKVF